MKRPAMKKTLRQRLDGEYERLKKLETTFLGYPSDAEFDYSPIYRFLDFPINNVGDPFESSTYRMQTKEFEREVLGFFARLLHIEDYWGYITNGGTEGNLYGLYAAREHFPKAPVFFSEHAHYSMRKNAHVLGLKTVVVKSRPSGEIDYGDFEAKVRGVREAIVVANIGTTMMGAIDKVPRLSRILDRHKVRSYIHADAALYGMVLPFVSDVRFDFRTKINSIAISGHKFIGSPIPCGVMLARRAAVERLRTYIEYIDAHDSTLSGSRDAFTSLVFWYRIHTIGMRGFKKQVLYSVGLADFLVRELKKIGWPDVRQSYVTVSFKRPSDRIVNKWELAAKGEIAHVICLPHESKAELRAFVGELAADRKG